jgi:hypothetical protein
VLDYDLTVSDIARRLHMSEDRVRRVAPLLGGVRVGPTGRWRFCWQQVERALHGGRIEAQAGEAGVAQLLEGIDPANADALLNELSEEGKASRLSRGR